MSGVKFYIVDVDHGGQVWSSVYVAALNKRDAKAKAKQHQIDPAAKPTIVNEITTYPVPFLCGDGTGEIILHIRYAVTGGQMLGWRGFCAFCEGDPCAEASGPETLIGAYFVRNSWAETCPLCQGRPI